MPISVADHVAMGVLFVVPDVFLVVTDPEADPSEFPSFAGGRDDDEAAAVVEEEEE